MTAVVGRTRTGQRVRDILQGPARYRAKTPWGVWSALLATAAIVLVPVMCIGLVAVAIDTLEPSGFEAGQIGRQMISLSMPAGVATAIGTQVLSLALVWVLAGRNGQRAAALGFTAPRSAFSTALLIALGFIVVLGLFELALYLTIEFDPFADSRFLVEGLRSPLWPFTVLMAVILAPLWEELVFRGFLLSALAKSRIGFAGGAVISSGLWAMLHMGYSTPALVTVLFAGLALSWLVWKTGNLWIAIVCHAVVNACAAVFAWMFSPY